MLDEVRRLEAAVVALAGAVGSAATGTTSTAASGRKKGRGVRVARANVQVKRLGPAHPDGR